MNGYFLYMKENRTYVSEKEAIIKDIKNTNSVNNNIFIIINIAND